MDKRKHPWTFGIGLWDDGSIIVGGFLALLTLTLWAVDLYQRASDDGYVRVHISNEQGK